VKITIHKPKVHVKPEHVKHSASLFTIGGTVFEAAHLFYPSGLILICIGAMVAIYEPYFVHELADVEVNHD